MSNAAPPTDLELAGWELAWARLVPTGDGGPALAALRAAVAAETRATLVLDQLAADPVVAALRKLFRAAGCDPTRYRPSSEALLRRVLQGEELPVIHPFVDLNNCLSIRLKVPCCIVDEATLVPPLVLRAGRPGEVLDSMRGPFDLAGKPLLADRNGPFGTPITDSHRVKVRPETRAALLVAYLPAELLNGDQAIRVLEGLLAVAPVATRSPA